MNASMRERKHFLFSGKPKLFSRRKQQQKWGSMLGKLPLTVCEGVKAEKSQKQKRLGFDIKAPFRHRTPD